MLERFQRKPETRIPIQVLPTDDGVDVRMFLSEPAMKILEDLASSRGKSIGDTIGEGLRLERLLADGKLLYRKKHWWGRDKPQELLSV